MNNHTPENTHIITAGAAAIGTGLCGRAPGCILAPNLDRYPCEVPPETTRIAAALGGEHRVPVYAHDGRRIGWRTTYITGPEAEALAAVVVHELRSSPGATS